MHVSLSESLYSLCVCVWMVQIAYIFSGRLAVLYMFLCVIGVVIAGYNESVWVNMAY